MTLRVGVKATLPVDLESRIQDAAGKTRDFREGGKAFVEKRASVFKGG